MTTRTAGRHRSTKSSTPPIPPPSLLLVDYLESGQFTGRPIAAPGPPGRKRSSSPPFTGTGSPPFTGSGRLPFTGSGSPTFTGAGSPDVARFGRSPSTPPSRPRIRQPPFIAPGAVGRRGRTSGLLGIGALTRPAAARHHGLRRTRRPASRGLSAFRPTARGRLAARGGSAGNRRILPVALTGVAVALSLVGYVLLRPPGTGGSGHHAVPGLTPPPVSVPTPSSPPAVPVKPKPPRPRPKRRTATPHAPASQQRQPGTAPVARPAGTPPSTAQTAAPLVVRYLIASEGPGGFQGEISVTNNGTQPISSWQIVVALPDDQVLSFSNASGFVSNGILLLQPGPGAQPIPPGGGQLNVFFAAEGAQTIPEACAFNDVVCS
jgi:Cellulose binding domain